MLSSRSEESSTGGTKGAKLHSRPSVLTDGAMPGLADPLRLEPSKSAEGHVSTWFPKTRKQPYGRMQVSTLAYQCLCWHTC